MTVVGTKVGTGFVEISPDFSRFQEKVGRKLSDALAPQFRDAGGRAGRELAKGMDRGGLGRTLSSALKRQFEKVGDDAGKAIADRIGKKARSAANDMFGLAGAIGEVEKRTKKAASASKSLETDMFGVGRAAKTSGKQIISARAGLRDWHREARAGSDGASRFRDRLRGLASDLRKSGREARAASGGFGGFDGGMARVNRGFSFFRNLLRTLKWPALIAGLGLTAQGLSALAAGAVAATSALGPLAGALIALPAAALVAAQAFGVLKLATAGIGDAVKAALDAEIQGGAQAVDTMRQQEDAAERVADAKRNLTSVQKQAKFAQEDLTQAREDARRELEDMGLAADRSRDSEQQAMLQLRQARVELNRTLADPKASGLDVRFAEEAVDQARTDLESTRIDAKRARKDYRDAQKAGVQGMPQVVAAKRAEADANQAVQAAQRDLTRAVKDSTAAMKEQGSAASTLQEKMSQLPVAGQKFVRFLVSLKPRLDALRATAAQGFLPGAEEGLRGLMGNFKEVRGIVGSTASALGKLASKAGRKLGSEVWGKDLTRIGKLNARILGRMGDAGLNLADALRHVMVAAEPFLDWLSNSTLELSSWLKGEAEAGRKSGRLAEFFERTRETMELLGPILKGVGGALLNIGEAARPLGNEILKALGGSAEGWSKWTDSVAGKNDLKQYFAEAKPAIFEMGKLIGAAGKAFFELGRQRGVAHLLRLVRTELIPAIRDLVGATTGFASGFLQEFGSLRDRGVPAFDAFVQVLIEHAAEAGVKIVKALGKGFLNASILGKLTIGAFVISQFGGKGKILAAGAAIGRWLGLGIAAGAASSGAAGGAAAGAGSAAAGGVAGGLLSRLKSIKWGRTGALAIGLALGENILNGVNRRMREGSDDLLDALGAIEEKKGVVRELQEQVLGPFIPDAFGDERGIKDETTAAKNLKAQLQEMLRKRVRLSDETVRSLRSQAAELDLTKKQRLQVERVFDTLRAGKRLGVKVDLGMDPGRLNRLADAFGSLRGGVFTSMGDIGKVVQRNMGVIRAELGGKSAEGRELLSKNFRAAAQAIKVAMENGAIPQTKAGLDRVRYLLRNARLISGEDPLGIAGGFAASWRKAGGINEEMMRRMIGDLGKMPKAARQKAFDAMLAYGRGLVEAGRIPLDDFRDFRSKALAEFDTLTTQGGKKGDAFARRLSAPFGDLNTNVGSAIKAIMGNTRRALENLGVKGALKQFAIKHPSFVYGTGQSPNLAEKQQGGFIVPGTGSGDKFKTALPIGSFVENREAARRLPFQDGGVVPVALEPGERVHFPERVRRIGADVLAARNDAVPRFPFQKGGPIGKPLLAGPAGMLRETGRAAIDKVHGAAREFVSSKLPRLGSAITGLLTGSGNVEKVFANVAKRLSKSKIASLALGMAGFAESGMRDLGFGHSTSQGSLQLLASTASGMGIDPHDEAAVSSAFLLKGFYGRGGANALAAQGLPAHLVAQSVQGSAFSDGSNYLAQEGSAKGWMRRFGLKLGGVVRRLASGGMVDPSWDPGSEVIASSIASLVGEYAKRYDADITQGYGPGGPSVSLGHTTTGTATDVVPRSGNWGGAFAKGLGVLTSHGIQVGYDGSVPGTDAWSGHGRGKHGHINWVGYAENETTSDARQRLRDFFNNTGGVDGEGPGSTSAAPKENILPVYRGAKTGNLQFGPMPKKLEAVNREIAKWEKATPTYRKAKGHAEKNGKPGVAQALGKNLTSIEERLKGLRGLRTRLRLDKARKALKKRVGKALGKFAGYEQLIEGSQRTYEGAAQDAEQTVALEPQSPELPANATDAQREAAEKSYVANFTEYVNSKERPGYGRVLDTVAEWRNNILRAETFGFGQKKHSVSVYQAEWESVVRQARSKIDSINRFSGAVAERVATFRRDNPKEQLPDWLRKQIADRNEMRQELPSLRLRDSQLTEAVGKARDMFFPGGENRLKPPPIPLAGSGTLEEALTGVQGIHWPDQHELLPASALTPPRVAGRFGGVIWDVQTSIEELGLKISQAANGLGGGSSDGGEGDSERASLLEELLRQANQRTAVSKVQKVALEGWDEMRRGFGDRFNFQLGGNVMPPFGGIAHTGAIVPGPAGAERTMVLKSREGVFTEEQMAAMGAGGGNAGGVVIESIVIHEDGRATVRFEGREFEAAVERVAKRNRPMGIPTAGGARR